MPRFTLSSFSSSLLVLELSWEAISRDQNNTETMTVCLAMLQCRVSCKSCCCLVRASVVPFNHLVVAIGAVKAYYPEHIVTTWCKLHVAS